MRHTVECDARGARAERVDGARASKPVQTSRVVRCAGAPRFGSEGPRAAGKALSPLSRRHCSRSDGWARAVVPFLGLPCAPSGVAAVSTHYSQCVPNARTFHGQCPPLLGLPHPQMHMSIGSKGERGCLLSQSVGQSIGCESVSDPKRQGFPFFRRIQGDLGLHSMKTSTILFTFGGPIAGG